MAWKMWGQGPLPGKCGVRAPCPENVESGPPARKMWGQGPLPGKCGVRTPCLSLVPQNPLKIALSWVSSSCSKIFKGLSKRPIFFLFPFCCVKQGDRDGRPYGEESCGGQILSHCESSNCLALWKQCPKDPGRSLAIILFLGCQWGTFNQFSGRAAPSVFTS